MDAVVVNLLEHGVPNLVVSFGVFFFFEMMVYYFMCKLLPNRLNIYVLIALSLVYALWSNLRAPALFGTGYHLWMNLFINVWTIFILIFFYRGKFWRRVIVYWYFDIIKTMCEAIAYVPIMLYHAHRGFRGEWDSIVSSVTSNAMLRLLYLFTFLFLFVLLGFLSLKIWRRLLLQKFQPFYLLFIVLPMGQRYSFAHVLHPNMGDLIFGILVRFSTDLTTIYHILALFGISISLVATVAILYYVLSYNKRGAIEAELRETKRVMELEQAHYRQLEQRSEELAKIRHDFNNQLASVTQLVRSGDSASAQALIGALSQEINNTNN